MLQLQNTLGNQVTTRITARAIEGIPSERKSVSTDKNTVITPRYQLSQGIVQRVTISQVDKENEDKKSGIAEALKMWREKGVEKLEVDPGKAEAFTGREYVKNEIASMENGFNAKWGAKDQYIAAEHKDEILAVMKVQEWGKKIQLSHIVAKPRAKEEPWPGGQSPVSALMRWVAQQGQEKSKPVELNAEDLSLIPLYRHFGYKMKDEKLEEELKNFEQDDLKDKGREQKKKLWAEKIEEMEKRHINLPEMVKA
jgi:hypothetical protein